jgi:outer membrane receptor protein involved in Fe transport
MLKKSVVLLLFLALVPFGIYAGTTGKIAGVVTDKSTGDPLPGVNVIVEGTTLGASTDIDGYYVILNVPPGFYNVKASYIGYTDMVIQEAKVSADLTTEINVAMEPTTLELGEAIVVTAQRELIRKDETNKVEIRTAEEIQALPIRNLNSLASLTAGTVETDGNVYVRGGRSNETAYVVDGVVQNELFFGGNRTDVNPNSIEELQVQTGGFNAEYGSIMSGLVIITTQAGSPTYHFTAEGITDEFLPKDNKDFGAYSYGYQDYNFTLSGPVIPGFKKLTFFGSFQRSIRGDRDPRLNWADGKTYTFVDPFNIPVYNANDSLIGLRNDTLSTTLNENAKPGNWENITNFNGKLRYRITNNIDVQVSGLVTIDKLQNANFGAVEGDVNATYNRAWASGMLVNSIHNPRTELNTQSYSFTLTHTLNPTTFYTLRGGYYYTFRERGDGVFFNDIFAYGDPAKNPFLPVDPGTGEIVTGVPLNNIIAQSWMGQGYLYNNYNKQKQQMYSVNLDFTRQQGKSHLIKFGGEFRYNTIRWYALGAYPGVVGLAPKLSAYGDLIAQYGEEYAWYLLYRNAGRADYFGYDFRGNEVDSGDWFLQNTSQANSIVAGRPDGPKHPIIGSAYVQDKIEFHDLVLNLGLRFDYLNPNDWAFQDPLRPFSYGGDPNKFDAPDVKDSEIHTFFAPRLGFAFPVSENTVFHAQYGKFYQMPRLVDLYASKNYVDILLLDHPYYDNIGFPNLLPERTTAYEIGFKQKMGSYAALDITAFYKETGDLVREQNFDTDIQSIGFMQNNDFGTVKGVEVGFTLRRFHNISASVNYSLSFAVGTGSNSNTLRNITWLQGDYPKSTNPLDFDQRHTGNINIDWRLGENKGPSLGNMKPLENFGVNMLLTFNSGRPYTAVRVVSEPFWGGGTGERPTSAINANYSPYNFMIDMKVDKYINLPFAKSRLNVYVWVLNLLNTENTVRVYPFTGDVDNNGWLDSSDGELYQQTASPEEIELYRKREANPFNYGPPRQIRLGMRLEI